MAEVEAWSAVQYLSGSHQMRGKDYDAQTLVKAVKGDALNNQYVVVNIDGVVKRIDSSCSDLASEWFAQWIKEKLDSKGLVDSLVLIPIPSSGYTVGDRALKTTPHALALNIARRYVDQPLVVQALAWSEPMEKCRNGGSRVPGYLYSKLRLVEDVPQGNIVFVDDVLTSGGHLKAAIWRLQDVHRQPVGAVFCGRTVDYQLDDPFMVPEETFDYIAR